MGTADFEFEKPHLVKADEHVIDEVRRGVDAEQLEQLGYSGAGRVDTDAVDDAEDDENEPPYEYGPDGVFILSPEDLQAESPSIDAAEFRHPTTGLHPLTDDYQDLDEEIEITVQKASTPRRKLGAAAVRVNREDLAAKGSPTEKLIAQRQAAKAEADRRLLKRAKELRKGIGKTALTTPEQTIPEDIA